MYYAIIADVHANLEALKAVLKDIKKRKIESILFLGDAVGYGPNPNECIEVLQEIVSESTRTEKVSLMGNHDSAVIGLTALEYFNPNARTAIEWTKDILTEENKAFLKNLPIFKSLRGALATKQSYNNIKNKEIATPRIIGARNDKTGLPHSPQSKEFLDIFLVHATPREPEQWHYLLTKQDAYINFHFFTEKICLIGHSHQPFIIEQLPEGEMVIYKDNAEIKDKHRYIINVGSVGQPRDGNPDAAYALLNENSIEIKRVSYDILSTQKEMRGAGLPSFLTERLARGR